MLRFDPAAFAMGKITDVHLLWTPGGPQGTLWAGLINGWTGQGPEGVAEAPSFGRSMGA